ncbi:MAG: GntR family transcriptional regulator [Oscillospiraceae bacterium]|nr:GntR family transcriptional regulator [Oscillospiraceae bacterium]
MLMQLDFASATPIYRQICDQLILGIADGRLCAGEKLPTIRALAVETGVNVMTINKAYQLLKQEGYITADRRGGTVVSSSKGSVSSEKLLGELRLRAAAAKLAGISGDNWLELCGLAYDGMIAKGSKDDDV